MPYALVGSLTGPSNTRFRIRKQRNYGRPLRHIFTFLTALRASAFRMPFFQL